MRVFAGEQKSPCATPCRTFHTSSKFLSSVEERTDDSFRVKIFLVPEVTVTITDFVKPTLSSMLSEVAIFSIVQNACNHSRWEARWVCGWVLVCFRRSSFFQNTSHLSVAAVAAAENINN